MISRQATKKLLQLASQFKAVAVIGPRQSGKTTLVKSLFQVEIKSGKTVHQQFFKNLLYWLRLSGNESGVILYGGEQRQERSNGITLESWRQLAEEGFLE
nr:hypothetical protein [Cytophagales bacterium]